MVPLNLWRAFSIIAMHTLLLDPEEGGMVVEQGSDGGHGEDSTVGVSIIVLTVVTAAAIYNCCYTHVYCFRLVHLSLLAYIIIVV